MKQIWFKKIGWVHYPISIWGYIFSLAGVLFLINTFVAIDRNSHSVSDTLYNFFLYFGVTFLLWNWLANKSS